MHGLYKNSKKIINKNDYSVGAVKLPKLGTKLSLGRKKPTQVQKLLLKPGKTQAVKITPQQIKKGLAVTGAVAGTIATAGADLPILGAVAGITGISAGAITAGASTVASGAILGTTLLSAGQQGGIDGLLNASGALLNSPLIQQNVPLANSANEAINTGLQVYNTGAGIAEGLGLKPPNLGSTSEEMFSLFSNSENQTTDRAINIQSEKTTETQNPLNPYSDMLNNPKSPYYLPPPTAEQGKKSTGLIPSQDKTKTQDSLNLGIVLGIAVLGYLFINKKGKKK